jgi:hypothetical protein
MIIKVLPGLRHVEEAICLAVRMFSRTPHYLNRRDEEKFQIFSFGYPGNPTAPGAVVEWLTGDHRIRSGKPRYLVPAASIPPLGTTSFAVFGSSP